MTVAEAIVGNHSKTLVDELRCQLAPIVGQTRQSMAQYNRPSGTDIDHVCLGVLAHRYHCPGAGQLGQRDWKQREPGRWDCDK